MPVARRRATPVARFDERCPTSADGPSSPRRVAHIVSDDPQAAFLTVWRFWQNWASAKDERFAFLVT